MSSALCGNIWRNSLLWTQPRRKRSENDPAFAESWGAERTVWARLIRWLCDEKGPAAGYVQAAGIRIHACRIEDDLNLSGVNIGFPVFLHKCRIVGSVRLTLAQADLLSLSGSLTSGILADLLVVRGSLILNSGFRAEGEVRLPGAHIGGDLNCSGGRFSTSEADPLGANMPYGAAIVASDLSVGGDVHFSHGFCALGSVVLAGGKIEGRFSCNDGNFINPGGHAIIADFLTVGTAIWFRRARASGEVRLNGTRAKTLECSGARFINPGGYALNADGIQIDGGVTSFVQRRKN